MKTKPHSLLIALALLAGVNHVKHLCSLSGAARGAVRSAATRIRFLASVVALACSIAPAAADLLSWSCGPYNQTNVPADFGSTVGYVSIDEIGSDGFGGVTQAVCEAQVVFAENAFVYDANGNVIGTQTIVNPSAECSVSTSWNGPTSETNRQVCYSATDAGASISGKVKALEGAPTNAAIPLLIQCGGYASLSFSDGGGGAYAESQFAVYSSDGTLLKSFSTNVNISPQLIGGSGSLYSNYSQTISSAKVSVGNTFDLVVGVAVTCILNNNPSSGSSSAEGAAYADPSVEIDPSYQYANYFTLDFGKNPVFSPPTPMSLCLTNLATNSVEILLTCPLNNVYGIQANSDLTTTNWTTLAVVTNLTGSAVSYTDAPVVFNPQRFYRAVALGAVQ
jgi:hypothetical protein